MGETEPRCLSNLYAVCMLIYQSAVILLLNLFQVSPLCSHHIHLFLKMYIPTLMAGQIIILFLIINTQTHNRLPNLPKLLAGSMTAFIAGSFIFHITAVLLGAAFIEAVDSTFLFACLCSTLTVFPLYIANEGRWEEFVDLLPDLLDVRYRLPDAVKLVACWTVAGAWVGAFPIPLDWDRDWQKWPITVCVGALGGNCFGLVVVLVMCSSFYERMSHKGKLW